MIPHLDPVGFAGAAFLFLTTLLVLIAWFGRRSWFVPVLAASGLVMAVSWLKPLDAAMLVVFLLLPYAAARASWGRERSGTAALAAVVTGQILLFLIFKRYWGFDLLGALGHPVAIVGLSYILFRQLHLVVEAPFLGDMPLTPARYLAYMLSPWTLLAGPIQSYDSFSTGLAQVGPSDDPLADAHRIVTGLLKAAVLAPPFLAPSKLGNLVAPDATWLDGLVVLYGYPVFLYLNFSGYVDVMIGTARLCGFKSLPENFNRPYLARNSQDFWRRWHMSFGTWIRTYLFSPLAMTLARACPAPVQVPALALAVFLVFVVVGLWHGPTANFLVFGILQGLGVLAVAVWESRLKRRLGPDGLKRYLARRGVRVAAIAITFHFNCLTFLLLNNSLSDIANVAGAYWQ